MPISFADVLLNGLAPIRILARRMLLETPHVQATVPLLRGVWGAALHDLDPEAYAVVFHPQESPREEASPAYVLRPAPPDPAFAPAIEWVSIGPAVDFDSVLVRAWDIASGMGLGSRRDRFHIRRVRWLNSDGSDHELAPKDDAVGRAVWSLDRVSWPWDNPETTPCTLEFFAPLRLRRHGKLIEQPTFSDLIVAATRRIRAYLPKAVHDDWDQVARNALSLSRDVKCTPWRGRRLDLQRYSASQQADLELQGVSGSLALPHGPGPLWPLLAAAQWLHLGKSPILGLGQLCVLPAEKT